MLMKQRIVLLLIIGLSSYGSTFTSLLLLSEKGSVSLPPRNNNASELGRNFQNKQRGKIDETILQSQVPKLYAGRCPPIAARRGGKVLGVSCFIVRITLSTFAQSRNDCHELAGGLAEPLPILKFSHSLYAALKGVFPTEFGKIEGASVNAGRLWIGYKQKTTDAKAAFKGPTFGNIIVKGDAGIFEDAEDTDGIDGAAITETGFWRIFPIETRLPYICQFPLI